MTTETLSQNLLKSDQQLPCTLMKVLVIEDDQKTASFIARGLREAGLVVDICNDGSSGADLALTQDYDTAIIDLMLPGIDGLSIIRAMRENNVGTPVLILSAKRSVSDRIDGLETGGDDYLVKPFAFSELLARVQALVRRHRKSSNPDEKNSDTLKIADLELNAWKRIATRANQEIKLRAKEFTLLEYLLRNKGRIVSKTSILENVYEYNFDPQTNVVDVLVCRLRNKIDKGYSEKLLHTVRGMGYILEVR